jgi:hypothetical protein
LQAVNKISCFINQFYLKSNFLFQMLFLCEHGLHVPKFYALITSLLVPTNERSEWEGLKTLGQLKREKGVKIMPDADSLYKVVF